MWDRLIRWTARITHARTYTCGRALPNKHPMKKEQVELVFFANAPIQASVLFVLCWTLF
jgi:hypothetical protein